MVSILRSVSPVSYLIDTTDKSKEPVHWDGLQDVSEDENDFQHILDKEVSKIDINTRDTGMH